jgi:hypothetical protein
MVFSTETIMRSNTSPFKDNNKQEYYLNEDRSFFIETLNYILQEDIELNQVILQSNTIITEDGFIKNMVGNFIKRIDPKAILIKLLNSFMNLLDKLWRELKAFIMQFDNSNHVIKKYSKQINNLSESIYYPEDRYIYTNLGINTSYTSYKNEIEKEFSNLVLNLSTFNEFKKNSEIISKLEEIKNNLDLSESYFDEIRGYSIGSSSKISKENFAQELFKYFRNDGNKVSKSNISPNEIKKILDNYQDYKTNLKMIEKDKNDMRAISEKIKKDIKNINFDNYVNMDLPEEAGKIFISIIQDKVVRINNLCSMYLQIFSAKSDAIKESHVQNSNILIHVCRYIVKEGL